MTKYKEILRLSGLGISSRKISSSCGCSKTPVLKVLARSRELGLTFPPETSPCKIVDMDIVMRRERCRRSAIARNR